jgi:predicted ATP-dependent endonuclease of OLD family
MNLKGFGFKNYRRLKDVYIDLESQISIFVGANNSGKTSATSALNRFVLGDRAKFSFHDFSASTWSVFNQVGSWDVNDAEHRPKSPVMSVDLWFTVSESDLHRIIDLLPSLDWASTEVGIRISLQLADEAATLAEYHEAKAKADAKATEAARGGPAPTFWPSSFAEYLEGRVPRDFEFRYYVLDPTMFDEYKEKAGYEPPLLHRQSRGTEGSVIERLLLVHSMDAQRYLSENSSGARTENLSRCLGRFYKRNLDQLEGDLEAITALTVAQKRLNDHLHTVFNALLGKLGRVGYPGLGNPKIDIKTTLNPAAILGSNDGARVYYALDGVDGDNALSLPDQYSGLGFKNLIYMVVELLDLDAQWRQAEERPPLHVIIIEEPEAHLHAQLQQVFIREVLTLLAPPKEEDGFFSTQLIVTTHSSHILYERGFKPIRYFRRQPAQETDVSNLSVFYEETAPDERNFLERYLKLTHCDLFFADAAILVEGNVERLLTPLFIERSVPRLSASCLSILEVGGAYAHRFKALIEFLGITCLVITDLDSVKIPDDKAAGTEGKAVEQLIEKADADDEDDEVCNTGSTADGSGEKKQKAPKPQSCSALTVGAITANYTLKEWLPKKSSIAELLAASKEDRTQLPSATSLACVHVCYQTKHDAIWGGVTAETLGRTIEEAFAFENLASSQSAAAKALRLRVKGADKLGIQELCERIHDKVKDSNFNKTNFALGIMDQKEGQQWAVPHYIVQGLQWLEAKILPVPAEPQPPTGPLGVAERTVVLKVQEAPCT